MISVLLDGEILQAQRRGGISRYLTEMITAFLTMPDLGVAPTRRRWITSNQHALESGLGWEPRGIRSLHPRVRKVLYQAGNSMIGPRTTPDLVHATFYREQGPRKSPAPLITTVYDMAPERLSGLFARNPHRAKREYVDSSAVVICISEFCRSELLALWGPLEARTEVVPLGVRTPEEPPRTITDRDSMILYVGDRRAYKDFDVLLQAFSRLGTRFDRLVVAGGGTFTSDELRSIERLRVGTKVFNVQPNDAGLWELYSKASAFVFPSRYEGFGLPTLEAMSAGCPTVLSTAGAHLEVAQNAALYFDVGDPEALCGRLIELASDQRLAEHLQALGLARASEFTWERTARETARIYRSLLAGPPPSRAVRCWS